jgi:lysine/ornithine N-monooxygenase
MENYPTKILQNTKFVVKNLELAHKDAISKLEAELKKPIGNNVRNLNEKITINEISEIYIPIYEARLVGPKKKVEILRIDAARNKIL